MVTETSLAESVRVDEFCHQNSIAFIKVGVVCTCPVLPGSGWRSLLRRSRALRLEQ